MKKFHLCPTCKCNKDSEISIEFELKLSTLKQLEQIAKIEKLTIENLIRKILIEKF